MSTLRNFSSASASRSIVSLVALAASCVFALPCSAQNRLVLPRGRSNLVRPTEPRAQTTPTPQSLAPQLVAGLVTQDLATGGQTPASLVQALVGAGVTVTNIQYNGAPIAAGAFSGGTGIIGFAQGIVLSSGDVASIVGPQNLIPNTSTDNQLPGDADLDALVGGLTQDASVLEFDFTSPSSNVISFQYVFASEEYDEWVNTQYNDVFAFILNGQNIALIPTTTTPVAINNVNCDNPFNPLGGLNCSRYTSNDCDSLGLGFPCTLLATEMDGLTSVFSAVGTVQPGQNHIKLAVADRGDGVYDTDVFIRGESFVGGNPAPAFDPPSPCGETLAVGVDMRLVFAMDALATNGLAGEAVTLSVTGDVIPLAGGHFLPALPVGPAPSVETEFEWRPHSGDVGTYVLHFTATDQVGQTSTCDVTIEVTSPGVAFCFGDGSLADHTTPCPCGNDGANGHGCGHSFDGDGAQLLALGSRAADTVELVSTTEPASSFTLFMQHDAAGDHVFHDGVLCAGGNLVRLRGRAAVNGQASFPNPLFDSSITLSQRGGVSVGSGAVRYYAAFYRNASSTFCPPATANVTNGYTIVW